MLGHVAEGGRFGSCMAVLAAGSSSRMGFAKQLAVFEGTSLVRHACLRAIASCFDEVCVVTGSYADLVAAEVADLDVRIVENDDWRTGQASSVRAAVRHCVEGGASYLGILPVDMPLIDASHLSALLDAARTTGVDMAASIGLDGPMAPCVFSNRVFRNLCGLHGDRGAVRIIRDASLGLRLRSVEFSDPAMSVDVDTPDDLLAVARLARESGAFGERGGLR